MPSNGKTFKGAMRYFDHVKLTAVKICDVGRIGIGRGLEGARQQGAGGGGGGD